MKKIAGLIIALFFTLTNMSAMSYEEARDRARFLTDKMAYELNLNDAQYNDAYEINLDYLMNIRTANDVSGVYLQYRNADLRYILYDWQYSPSCGTPPDGSCPYAASTLTLISITTRRECTTYTEADTATITTSTE